MYAYTIPLQLCILNILRCTKQCVGQPGLACLGAKFTHVKRYRQLCLHLWSSFVKGKGLFIAEFIFEK